MKVNIQLHDRKTPQKVFHLLAKCFPEYWMPKVKSGVAGFTNPIISVTVEYNGNIIGHCGIYIFEFYFNKKLQKAAGLCAVAVDPNCRGMGIAGKMCDYVLEYCHKEEIFFSPLYTGIPKVYEKRGWQIYNLPAPKRAFGESCHSYKKELDEQQKNCIRELYSNGFVFDGKINRTKEQWKLLFGNKDFLWYLTNNAYALIIKNKENYILCEAYTKNGCWNELFTDGLLLYLPSTHPLLSKHNFEDGPIDIWHEEVVMINIINAKFAMKSSLSKAIEQNTLFFPLADKF